MLGEYLWPIRAYNLRCQEYICESIHISNYG